VDYAQILMHHIRATLPDIKLRITEQQKKFNAELQSLGGLVADNPVRGLFLNVYARLV
jgi:hypothetical protein